jgi:hypothetical protein
LLRLLTVFVYLGLAYGCGQLLLLHCVAAGPARALFTVLHKPGNTHPDASSQQHSVIQSQQCAVSCARIVCWAPKRLGLFSLKQSPRLVVLQMACEVGIKCPLSSSDICN